MLNKIFAVIFLGIMLAVSAFADQAAYVTKKQAEAAAAFLKGKKQIRHYCAPCDDKGDKIEDINTIDAAVADESKGFWEVKVNGEGIDLAYVYFQTKDGKWKNLAKEIGVKVSDVPKYLPDVVAGE
jgi:hypothetical protein